MKSEFPGAVPEIPASDVNKAVAYYKDRGGLGRRRAWTRGNLKGKLPDVSS